MLMAAATHIVGSASAHSSISPPTTWHPVLLVPNHNHHQVLYDGLDLATPSPSPSPTTPATASPACHNHEHHLRPASRQRAGRPQRRPRPSRKLTTTYIRTDAASFRRMVHQVTGADDDVLLLHLHGAAAAPGPELLYRHAPAPHSRAGLTLTTTTTTDTLLLPPTLDTSAFLMLGAAAGVGGSRGGAKPARPPGVSCDHGSSVVVDPGVAVQVKTEEGCSGAGDGFPSLESWDDEDGALFYD